MSVRNAIYLDANAGTPLQSKVVQTIHSLLESSVDNGLSRSLLANPSSIHRHGRRSKRLVADAREAIAKSLGKQVDPDELIFTSSGTEANQLAIRAALEPLLLAGRKPHWITTAVEHDSVLQMVEWLQKRGGSVSLLPVDPDGVPDVNALSDLCTSETALVSVVWVNNETGAMAPVEKIGKLTRERGVPLHLDAAQAWGKILLDLPSTGAQMVSLSGHKIGALAGTGVLWSKAGNRVEPFVLGKQEKARRGGTESLLGIVSMGAASSNLEPLEWSNRVRPLRDRLESEIRKRIPDVLVNASGAERIANTLSLTFDRIESDSLVMSLDLAGYSVSSGSACSSGVPEPSHVLMAMGRTKTQAQASIRISLVDEMPWEILEGFVRELEAQCNNRRTITQI